MKNFTGFIFIFAVSLVTAALSACGGGSSNNDAAAQTAAASSVAQMGGTYILPCTGEIFSGPSSVDGATRASRTVTIVITPDAATGNAKVSVHNQYYRNSDKCDAAMLDEDLTFFGIASDKAGNKDYKTAAGKPVTAKVVSVAYTGLRLSKGNLKISLPTAGATTDMAYVLDNNTLYLSKGHREKDGLGDALTLGAVRQ